MTPFQAKNVPLALRQLPQWLCWKTIVRKGLPTKVPIQTDGKAARSNDPETWTEFETVVEKFEPELHDGIGFVFADGGGLCGVDLDGCRNPETGEVAPWAKEIIQRFATYAEVSPSLTGVKLFIAGKSPFDSGKKIEVKAEAVCDKTPAIEVYDRLRYFAVTGWRVKGPREPQAADDALRWLKDTYWKAPPKVNGTFYCEAAIIDRARKYLVKIPAAVAGQGGHNRTFHAACVLVCGFGLSQHDALNLLREWNQTCDPPWSDRELIHKVQDAAKQEGERNYLRLAKQDQWDSIAVPRYQQDKPKVAKKRTTLVAAARQVLEKVKLGKTDIVNLGIPELDYALDGGVEPGEVVIFGARPSHGKSAVALQCTHYWTMHGRKVLVISEEMSAVALGKRALQFISDVPKESWNYDIATVERQLSEYESVRQDAIVIESCGTAQSVVDEIDRAVAEDGVEMVVVDYAQLLRNEGKSRYEQITNTSVMLRQAASRHKIVLLVLCQLSRSIETRKDFVPIMSDIKETGQLEQDADVIVFLCWPHRMDRKRDPKEYQFFVAKNRNRAILNGMVECKFNPSRQMIGATKVEEMENYAKDFDEWNNR